MLVAEKRLHLLAQVTMFISLFGVVLKMQLTKDVLLCYSARLYKPSGIVMCLGEHCTSLEALSSTSEGICLVPHRVSWIAF